VDKGQSTLFDFISFDRMQGLGVSGGFVTHPLILPDMLEYRKFQMDLANEAMHSNLLVVIPTGLGKTIIALLAAAESIRLHDRKILFVAPTRPLVMQHKDTFEKFLLMRSFGLFTGSTPAAERRKEWHMSRVIFATPQVIENDLKNGLYSIEDAGLCIFDEAHRAVGNYSYVNLAQQCRDAGLRILALTASPGAKRAKIEDILSALGIEKVETRGREDGDVAPYVQSINEEIETVTLSPEIREMLVPVNELLAEKIRSIQRMGFLRYRKASMVSRKDLLSVRGAIMSRGRSGGYLFGAMHNSVLAIHAYHCSELLETQGVEPARLYIERMKKEEKKSRVVKSFLNDERISRLSRLLNEYVNESHPKLQRLKEILMRQIEARPESRIIVFSQYRDTIETIMHMLGREDISAKRFIGQAERGEDRGMSQKEQKAVLGEFHHRQFNVLVASSIGEEGIDVPDVDLVVFYEPIPSEIRYIQRKGRTGRSSIGRVIILSASGTRDEAYLRASHIRERKMNRIVEHMGH